MWLQLLTTMCSDAITKNVSIEHLLNHLEDVHVCGLRYMFGNEHPGLGLRHCSASNVHDRCVVLNSNSMKQNPNYARHASLCAHHCPRCPTNQHDPNSPLHPSPLPSSVLGGWDWIWYMALLSLRGMGWDMLYDPSQSWKGVREHWANPRHIFKCVHEESRVCGQEYGIYLYNLVVDHDWSTMLGQPQFPFPVHGQA